jgi:hypothetical protein
MFLSMAHHSGDIKSQNHIKFHVVLSLKERVLMHLLNKAHNKIYNEEVISVHLPTAFSP